MIRNLAFIGFVSPAADEWRTFGPEVLGAQLSDDAPAGAVGLRVDDACWRIAVHPGPADDLAYLGWDVGSDAALDALTARLAAEGIVVARDDELARERRVEAAAHFVDPFGFRHELTHGLRRGGPFAPGRPMAGFVTGDQGLGHVVLLVPDLAEGERFLGDVLGLEVSDSVGAGLRFFHCPGTAARHHTVAIAGTRGLVGMHHLMLEVRSLDDVGTALDLVHERGLPLAMTLGRHTNDLMTSFYVRTPSGFEVEYGTGGLVIDDRTWQVGQHDTGSLWGHKPPAERLAPQIVRRVAAAESKT